MAKGTGVVIALAAGAGLLLLASSSKGKSAATPALPRQQKPPPIKIDADDGHPTSETVPLDVDVTDLPVAIAPVMERTPAEHPGMPDVGPSGRPSSPEFELAEDAPSPAAAFAMAAKPVGGGVYRVANEDGSPVRANPAEAKRSAQSIADNIRTKANGYDRARLAVWQALAGLRSVDGVYGPESQGALTKMGAKSVPRPLFKGAK
jgi:hypothetical protein